MRGFFVSLRHPGERPDMASLSDSNNVSAIEITNDISCIDLDRVHHWLARKSYWAGQMPRAVFDRAVRRSLCFGALDRGATAGFARVISDRATFAYVSDVFVDPTYRGQGISKALMAAIMAHCELQNSETVGAGHGGRARALRPVRLQRARSARAIYGAPRRRGLSADGGHSRPGRMSEQPSKRWTRERPPCPTPPSGQSGFGSASLLRAPLGASRAASW